MKASQRGQTHEQLKCSNSCVSKVTAGFQTTHWLMLVKKTEMWKASSLSCHLNRLNQKIGDIIYLDWVLSGFLFTICSSGPSNPNSIWQMKTSQCRRWVAISRNARVCCQEHLLLLVTPNVWPCRGGKWKINIVLMHWLNLTRLLYITHKQEWEDGLEKSPWICSLNT